MFLSFHRRSEKAAAASLYDAVVARARLPTFYTRYEVPDTVDGRFEMIALHAALVIRRLQAEGKPGIRMGQALFDRMFVDMDLSMRERGVGDLSVPKHMKRMMKAVHGRGAVYGEALDKMDDAALIAGVSRNIYATDHQHTQSPAMAEYIRNMSRVLDRQQGANIIGGTIRFPEEHDNEQENRAGHSAA